MNRNLYGIHTPHSYDPVLPASAPMHPSEVRSRVDEAIEVLDILEGAKQRCETLILAAEIDAGVNLEGCLGWKGNVEDVSELLAELVMRFTAKPEQAELLYRNLRKLQSQASARKIQEDLDAA